MPQRIYPKPYSIYLRGTISWNSSEQGAIWNFLQHEMTYRRSHTVLLLEPGAFIGTLDRSPTNVHMILTNSQIARKEQQGPHDTLESMKSTAVSRSQDGLSIHQLRTCDVCNFVRKVDSKFTSNKTPYELQSKRESFREFSNPQAQTPTIEVRKVAHTVFAYFAHHHGIRLPQIELENKLSLRGTTDGC